MKIYLSILLLLSFAINGFAEDYNRFAQVKTVSCDFKMERYLAIAPQPLISSGHFYFRQPDFLRWEYLEPQKHGFLIDGKKAFSWQEEKGEKIIKDISGQPLARMMSDRLRMFISMDMEQIGKSYRLEPFADGLDLIPLDIDNKQQQIAKIRLIFDAKLPTVTQTIIMEKSGEKTVITYFNNQLDQPIPDAASVP